MAIRKTLTHDTKTRERIQTSQIVNRLTDHLDGKVELSATQIRAAEILLRKSLPDLSAVEHSGEIGNKSATEMTRDELLAYISSGSNGAARKDGRSIKPAEVH
jgi:hypothetical protein